ICYNDLGDFYYSHGRLTEAFKSYIKTEEYFSASEHVVQMCMKAILISVELGHNVRVLNFVSKAQGCQDPLSPIAIAKLQAVAGLARLGRKEYKLAAQEFLETGPELGSNYSEVIAAQDVATYGSLCALAFLNYSDIKMKVIENAKFGSFLSLFPEIRGLVNDFYYRDYMASSYTVSELQWVLPTSSPAQNEAEGDPHVNGTEAELNAMYDAALVQSTQYNFVKSKYYFSLLGRKAQTGFLGLRHVLYS
uniref:26S proteasome regulatory subunit Rpn7 N-terminal domain-containing protein n=1 Tax=Aegilops tauschii subsp. strangulata TaxID=200361 RepID=A0A453KY79_AEGTS